MGKETTAGSNRIKKVMTIKISKIREKDALTFLELKKKLDMETEFMLIEPGEREDTEKDIILEIKSFHTNPGSTILVAEYNDKLIGYCSAQAGNFRRNRHSAYVIIGLLRDYTNKQIGSLLMDEIEKDLRSSGIKKLELSVASKNIPALKLYTSKGFQIEGLRKNALFINSEFVDEFYMGKIL